ncbi:MAG: magnesium transporter [Acidobacteriales bacterium]|nr:magnesium transporter [Terriglobales bacterium]
MNTLALSQLLGAPVVDAAGAVGGRVREVALAPQDDPVRVAAYIVRTAQGDRILLPKQLLSVGVKLLRTHDQPQDWTPLASTEGFLLLERDLLDQQIIDVHGRKVVRVNDVDFEIEPSNGTPQLRIREVEIGPRGAVRRLLKGIVPRPAISALVERLPQRVIPWDFVDLIETDPSRRVKLKIEHDRLARLHPADIADILEELAPAQREAVFGSLDEDVAAEALEEIDPRMQTRLVESLDSGHAADIVEEMDPDAAADLLEQLPDARSEEILEEMEEEEREEVEELLEHEENTAAGRMTTEYISVVENARVYDVISLLRRFEGGLEPVSTIYVVDGDERLVGHVPLARIAMSPLEKQVHELISRDAVSCRLDATDHEVATLFDKYNLLTLPVVDEDGKLCGLVTADDVISMLRKRVPAMRKD